MMLQRIQTIYLFLAFLVSSFYAYWLFVHQIVAADLFEAIAAGVTAGLIFINIFLFRNRKLQIILNNLAIFVLIVLLGLSIFQAGLLSGEKQFSEKDIKLLVPVISIVFLLIANKYIKRDERLVKSVDRIR